MIMIKRRGKGARRARNRRSVGASFVSLKIRFFEYAETYLFPEREK